MRVNRVESGRTILRAYPRWWRDRYGDEVADLLEQRPLDASARIDLLRGALDAHLGGDGRRSFRGAAAMLVAGAAWTIAGAASVTAPTPPDWPGYLVETLPVAVVGAIAALVAGLALARRAWPTSGAGLEATVIVLAVAHLAWVALLLMALVGGPYGAVTAAGQSAAALTVIAVGLIHVRMGRRPSGEFALLAGVAWLVPSPAAWLAGGAAWTASGLWQLVDRRAGDDHLVRR